MKTAQHTAQHGFTLLEMLIALALMAMLSVLSWQALDASSRAGERLGARADDTLSLLRVMGQIETDLAHHADRGVLPGRPVTGGLPAGIRWAAPRLTVTRAAGDGIWQDVVWYLEGQRLWRAAGLPATVLPLPEAQGGDVMLEGVSRFAVRAWRPGQGWADASDEGGAAMAGLEITLARGADPAGSLYRKVVLLP